MRNKVIQLAALILAVTVASGPVAATESAALRDQFVEARLLSEKQSFVPGQPVRLGLLLKHDAGWHTYWKASATGYGTSIYWDLPDGFAVSELEWPVPDTYDSQGWIEYVYSDEVLLIATLSTPPGWSGAAVRIGFTADWLMCTDICVPGEVRGELILPASASPAQPSRWQPLFAEHTTRLPVPAGPYAMDAWVEGKSVVLEVRGELPQEVYFFDDQGAFEVPASLPLQRLGSQQGRVRLNLNDATPQAPAQLSGVLRAQPGWPAADDAVGIIVAIAIAGQPPVHLQATPQSGGLAGLLVLAFVGGLILNLMPCVFPVLGIKIMGFVGQTGQAKGRIVRHGLVFTFGVLLSFWILAGVLLALRAGGEQLGWGFQLQSPGFVLFLTIFLFAFALNLSGLFEIGQSAVGVGSGLTAKSGYSGSFFSGVLATVVATPCAAPFLAPALGAALTLPPLHSLVVFTSIGTGLASPYLLFSAFPQLVRFLPRPGAWMESFKQFMAFLLYATVAYLLWVLAAQLSETAGYPPFALLNLLFGLVMVAMSLWIYGRWGAFHRPLATRLKAYAASVVVAGAALYLAYPAQSPASASQQSVQWQDWEPGKAEQLAAAGQVVYVDFTARWCVTCQTNKATVFSSGEVIRRVHDENVVLLRADWTNRDPLISAALQSFRRSAVPFNLVYGPSLDAPIILPEILTPGTVLQAWDIAKGL